MILSAVFRLCSPAGSPFENRACYRLWSAESHHSPALPLPTSAVAHCRDSSPVIGRPWGSILYSHEDHRVPASPGRFMRCVDRSGFRHRRAAAYSLLPWVNVPVTRNVLFSRFISAKFTCLKFDFSSDHPSNLLMVWELSFRLGKCLFTVNAIHCA